MRSEEAVSSMLCPVCRTSLSMSERGGVEIDFCPSCRGVWLDRGELDKIIERTAEPPAETHRGQGTASRGGAGGLMGMAASLLQGDDDRHGRYRDDRYDDRYDNRRPRKKKSVLSDFFD